MTKLRKMKRHHASEHLGRHSVLYSHEGHRGCDIKGMCHPIATDRLLPYLSGFMIHDGCPELTYPCQC